MGLWGVVCRWLIRSLQFLSLLNISQYNYMYNCQQSTHSFYHPTTQPCFSQMTYIKIGKYKINPLGKTNLRKYWFLSFNNVNLHEIFVHELTTFLYLEDIVTKSQKFSELPCRRHIVKDLNLVMQRNMLQSHICYLLENLRYYIFLCN